jgi:ATP-dependent Lon protease
VKEKVLGAVRAGIREIILPIDNEADLEDIPREVQEQVTFHLAETLDDVMDVALENGVGAAGRKGKVVAPTASSSDDPKPRKAKKVVKEPTRKRPGASVTK